MAGTLAFAAGALVIAALLLAYYKLTWGSLTAFNLAIDVWADPFPDFGRYYYPMGAAIFRTGMPVEGFVYSPFVAILLAAFSPLGLSTAILFWVGLQVLAIVLYVLLIRRLVPAPLPLQLFFVALTLSSFPLLHNFKFGQVPVFTTVALLGMLVCYERGRMAAAALLFAFAVSFKWYPLIFLALFVARRDWRFLLWAAGAGALFLVVVPVALLGFEQTLRFYEALRGAYGGFGWTATSYNSQYFPHVIVRLVRELWGPAPFARPFLRAYGLPVLQVISWAVVAANVALVYRVKRLGLRHANLWSAVALFLSVPFMLGTSWPVDLVPLSFAQAFLVWAILNKDETTVLPGDGQAEVGPRPVTLRPALAWALVLLSVVLSNILLFNFIGNRTTYGTFGCVLWADALLLAAVYLLLAPRLVRRSRTPQPVPHTDSAHAGAA
jgi:hypothetical protein